MKGVQILKMPSPKTWPAKLKEPCVLYEPCQTPEEKTTVCFWCGWLKKKHKKIRIRSKH
jgi:hypothetical protein